MTVTRVVVALLIVGIAMSFGGGVHNARAQADYGSETEPLQPGYNSTQPEYEGTEVAPGYNSSQPEYDGTEAAPGYNSTQPEYNGTEVSPEPEGADTQPEYDLGHDGTE